MPKSKPILVLLIQFFVIFQAETGFPQEETKIVVSPPERNLFSTSDFVTVRFSNEIVSQPWSNLKLTSELEFSRRAFAYCGKWDYLFWFLAERGDVRQVLGISSTEEKQFFLVKPRVEKLRRDFIQQLKLRTTLAGTNGVETVNKEIESLTRQMETTVKEALSSRQTNRLEQVELQFRLKVYPKEVCAQLAVAFPELKDAEIEEWLRGTEGGREIIRNHIANWLESAIQEEKLRALKQEVSEFGLRHDPILELIGLDFYDNDIVGELRDVESIVELWDYSSKVVFSCTGVVDKTIERTKQPSGYGLLMALTISPSLQKYLELVPEQVTQSREIALRIKNKKVDVKSALGELLLPHQLEHLQTRAVWREVELYGLGPCLMSGRLGKHIGLARLEYDSLKKSCPKFVSEMKQRLAEHDRSRFEDLRTCFDVSGLSREFAESFGSLATELKIAPRSHK